MVPVEEEPTASHINLLTQAALPAGGQQSTDYHPKTGLIVARRFDAQGSAIPSVGWPYNGEEVMSGLFAAFTAGIKQLPALVEEYKDKVKKIDPEDFKLLQRVKFCPAFAPPAYRPTFHDLPW